MVKEVQHNLKEHVVPGVKSIIISLQVAPVLSGVTEAQPPAREDRAGSRKKWMAGPRPVRLKLESPIQMEKIEKPRGGESLKHVVEKI